MAGVYSTEIIRRHINTTDEKTVTVGNPMPRPTPKYIAGATQYLA